MAYLVLKFIHVLGVVILLGNVTVTAIWKVFADRTHNATIVAFAQKLVVGTDWVLTVSGIVLIMIGGYGMAAIGKVDLIATPWLLWGQVLFLISGLLWLFFLVPLQSRQSKLSSQFKGGIIPEQYWQLGRVWLFWGLLATVPLVAAMFFMVTKM